MLLTMTGEKLGINSQDSEGDSCGPVEDDVPASIKARRLVKRRSVRHVQSIPGHHPV